MRARAFAVALLIVACASLGSGCDIGLENPTPTGVSATSVVPSCTLNPVSTTQVSTESEVAPSYEAVSKYISDFSKGLRSDPPSATWHELDVYLAELKGKRLDDWQ
jgi:hypothetical protein